MTHNLAIGLEAEANHNLALLFSTPMDTDVADGVHVSPGVWMMFDPAGEQSARMHTDDGSPLKIEVTAARPGNWMALHVALGGIPLSDAALLGFVMRLRAPQAMTLQPCLRSATPDGFSDCFFTKTVVAHGTLSCHLDCLDLQASAKVPAEAAWRELVFFLQPGSMTLDVHNLKLFSV